MNIVIRTDPYLQSVLRCLFEFDSWLHEGHELDYLSTILLQADTLASHVFYMYVPNERSGRRARTAHCRHLPSTYNMMH